LKKILFKDKVNEKALKIREIFKAGEIKSDISDLIEALI
jgi:hypothetical protein